MSLSCLGVSCRFLWFSSGQIVNNGHRVRLGVGVGVRARVMVVENYGQGRVWNRVRKN